MAGKEEATTNLDNRRSGLSRGYFRGKLLFRLRRSNPCSVYRYENRYGFASCRRRSRIVWIAREIIRLRRSPTLRNFFAIPRETEARRARAVSSSATTFRNFYHELSHPMRDSFSPRPSRRYSDSPVQRTPFPYPWKSVSYENEFSI